MPSSKSSTPSSTHRLLRWLLRLVLALVVLLALAIGVLYAWVVPRLDQWRPQLVESLQNKTGLAIEIGTLEARLSKHWLPVLQLQHATISSPQEPWRLTIARAQVGFSWQLLRGDFFGDTLIEQPQLQWTGPLHSASEPPQATPAEAAGSTQADSAGSASALQWLLKQPSIRIVNGSLSWQPAAPSASQDNAAPAAAWTISNIDLALRYHPLREWHELDLQMQAPQLIANAATLHLQGRDWARWAQQGLAAWSSASGRWRLAISELDLPALSQLMADISGLQAAPTVREGHLSVHSQGQMVDGELRSSLVELSATPIAWPITEQTRLQLTQAHLAATLTSQRQTGPDGQPRLHWQAEFKPAQLAANGHSWQSEPLQLELTTNAPAAPSNASAEPHPPVPSEALQVIAASFASRALDLGELSALLQAGIVHDAPEPEPEHASWQTRAALAVRQAQQMLAGWQPSGQLQALRLAWQRQAADTAASASPSPLAPWSLSARLHSISAGMAEATAAHPSPLVAGISNLSGRIDTSATGGEATLTIQDGAIQLPTVFDSGPIAVDRLQTQIQWRIAADGAIRVQVEVPELANPDAAGTASILWRSSSPQEIQAIEAATGQPAHALPGYLDLNAQLSRADTTAVWRYLPHSIPADVRRYVHEAIQGGHAPRVQFEVRGHLQQFPFDARLRDPVTQRYASSAGTTPTPTTSASQGPAPSKAAVAASAEPIFRISADLENVNFRYVPHYLLEADTSPLAWPDLQAVNGLLVFEGNRMDLAVQSAQLQAAPKVRVNRGSAWIDDLLHARVGVDVRASGPLADQLQVLTTTPIARMTDHVMDDLQGEGAAAFRLQLDIPLEAKQDAPFHVAGEVQLKGNQLRWWPQVPALSDLQGLVRFTDKGFSARDVQAQALGGPVVLNVVMADHVNGQPTEVAIDAQGSLSAAGLQQYAQQALANANANADQLLSALSGQTDYTLQLNTVGQRPYVSFRSSLQGLASQLPYPLDKRADESRPLRLVHSRPGPDGIAQMELVLADRIDANYTLQEPAPATAAQATTQAPVEAAEHRTAETQVRSGQLLIGQFSADEKRLPSFIRNTFSRAPGDAKVQAVIAQKQWDVAQWMPWLMIEQDDAAQKASTPQPKGAEPSWTTQLIPNVWYGHFDRLQWGAVSLHNAQIQTYQNPNNESVWTTHFKADETQGTLEYNPEYLDGTGLLRGTIEYLELPAHFGQDDAPADAGNADGSSQAAPSEAEKEANTPSPLANVRHLPTVDIEIGRLLLANRDWGKVALQAMNRVVNGHPNEWIINYLTVEVPEARLTAKGSWQDAQHSSGVSHLLSGRKKMDMQFTLDILDAGRLLSRMAMPNLLYAGTGQLNGRLSWQGSPLHPDIPSLHGDVNLDVRKGQFLKANAGAGRLLAVMSLQALPRRLTLDFRDIFSEGFAFDFVRGDIHLESGVASTNNMQMKGVNAGVVLEGSANILQETQNIHVLVVPELDAMTASLVATAINPVIGAGTFLAQFFFSKPLAQAAAQEFHIQGSWSDPIVERQSSSSAQ